MEERDREVAEDRARVEEASGQGEVAAKAAETLTYAELYRQASRFAVFLADAGVTVGDRVAGFLPNRPEAVVAMLAATSLGAIWSSCSPDFGFKGVMDRFGQIGPKVLVTADGYFHNGKSFDSLARVAEVARAIPAIEKIVVVPFVSTSLTGRLRTDTASASPRDP